MLALLGFGLIVSLATPLSAGYDEETHLIRAWEMAHLYFVPNEQLGSRLPFPAIYWDLSYRRQPLVAPVDSGFWSEYGSLALDSRDYVYANLETRSVYSPALLIPQALTLRYLGLRMDIPAVPLYYAVRIAGLLSYVVLCWLAVRMIPFGKWTMAILAVSPMALFQASTVSADTISNGIAFLFIGAVLAIARLSEIGWRQWGVLLALLALLFLGKVNLVFLALLPFLLIPPARYRMKSGTLMLALACLSLLAVEVAGWNALAYSQFTRALAGANPAEQIRFILADPFRFAGILGRDIWTNIPAYMRGWVGVYGYNYWPVPSLVYVLYPLSAILALWAGRGESLPDNRTRWLLGGLFGVGFVLSIISLYVAFTPARSLYVAGVQGRYFTPVMPLLLLALVGLPEARLEMKWPSAARRAALLFARSAWLLATASLVLYSAGLLLSYHVPCGSEIYRWGLCYQPQYKNWAPEALSSPPLTSHLKLKQEIVPACDGMTELRVWVNSADGRIGSSTEFLLRAPGQEKDVLRRTVSNEHVDAPGWLALTFPRESGSAGQLYLLELGGSSPEGIRVGYSEKPEYLAGKLFENNSQLASDILFQYGCVAGLQRAFHDAAGSSAFRR